MSESRKIVRCVECGLNQFRTESGNCRRCRKPAEPVKEPELEIQPEPTKEPLVIQREGVTNEELLEEAVRLVLRVNRSISQYKLAKQMSTKRTYISKVERGLARPNLVQLMRFAKAFGMSLFQLIAQIDMMRGWLRQATEN